MKVKKAGCILLNIETKQVALVYRKKHNDYTFPKGHLEIGESLIECAIRETEEETGHICHIVDEKEIKILEYLTDREDVECHYYLAIDDGLTNRYIDPKEKEDLVWKSIEEVEDTISYQDIKDLWNEAKYRVNEIIEKKY